MRVVGFLTRFSEEKNLVIKIMKVGGRAVSQAGVNNSSEHNCATVRNTLMIGRQQFVVGA